MTSASSLWACVQREAAAQSVSQRGRGRARVPPNDVGVCVDVSHLRHAFTARDAGIEQCKLGVKDSSCMHVRDESGPVHRRTKLPWHGRHPLCIPTSCLYQSDEHVAGNPRYDRPLVRSTTRSMLQAPRGPGSASYWRDCNGNILIISGMIINMYSITGCELLELSRERSQVAPAIIERLWLGSRDMSQYEVSRGVLVD